MTSRFLMAPGNADRSGQVIIRCLHGAHPEHRARRLVADILRQVGAVSDLPEVELAVSELVTNARQHAPRPYELRIFVTCTLVKIAVMDGGADHDALARRLVQAAAGVPADGESGRGLQIVTGLFPGSWGAEPVITCTGLSPAKQAWIAVPRSAVLDDCLDMAKAALST
jgi:hypothetical protein